MIKGTGDIKTRAQVRVEIDGEEATLCSAMQCLRPVVTKQSRHNPYGLLAAYVITVVDGSCCVILDELKTPTGSKEYP